CAIWLYFIGGALGAWDRSHISASLLDILIGSDRARAVVRVITCLLTVIISGWMTVWAFQYFYWTASRGARSLELGMPMAWVHAALPVGLVLMTLYFLIEFVDEARRTFGGRP